MLRPHIQKYLVGVITGELVDTELKGSHHDIIFKVCGSRPLALVQLWNMRCTAVTAQHIEGERELANFDLQNPEAR